jgi:hypothetical protein
MPRGPHRSAPPATCSGVDASLIARYFDNKAALYRAAVGKDSRNVNVSPETLHLEAFTVGDAAPSRP